MGEAARVLRDDSEPPSRAALPDWPRLMPIELAARYLSRSPTVLRERGPKPKRDGRSVLYDKKDLDRWADRLGDQPVSEPELPDAAADEERRFFERRRRRAGDG
jgi:hypothetical protein